MKIFIWPPLPVMSSPDQLKLTPPKKKILATTQCCADNLFKELYVQNWRKERQSYLTL
jgi:hypothetical protein